MAAHSQLQQSTFFKLKKHLFCTIWYCIYIAALYYNKENRNNKIVLVLSMSEIIGYFKGSVSNTVFIIIVFVLIDKND